MYLFEFSKGGEVLCMTAGSGRFTPDVLEPPITTSRQFIELYTNRAKPAMNLGIRIAL